MQIALKIGDYVRWDGRFRKLVGQIAIFDGHRKLTGVRWNGAMYWFTPNEFEAGHFEQIDQETFIFEFLKQEPAR